MTSLQELLLCAAHGPDQEARAAWAKWRKIVIWDEIDHESYYLLPALYRALERLEIDDEWRPRLAGIHRKAWYANHLLRRSTTPAIQALAAAGAPLMLLPGPALVYAYQSDCGLRPLDKLHCLVSVEHLQTAQRLLPEFGWAALQPRYHRLRKLIKGRASAFAFAHNSTLQRLVICWRLPDLPCATTNNFWAQADEILWEETPLKFIAPADARQVLGQAPSGCRNLETESAKLLLDQLVSPLSES